MIKNKDYTGQKFNKLTIIEKDSNDLKNENWIYVCECGKQINVSIYKLRSGHTKSCGCFQKEIVNNISWSDKDIV